MTTIDAARPWWCPRKTRFGPVALVWSPWRGRPKIIRVLLSASGVPTARRVAEAFPGATPSSCAEMDVVADQIAAFLGGSDIRFSLEVARLDLCSGFQQRVLRAEHAIPRGRVSTYRRIASHLGDANGARAVGAALAGNPFPVLVPCHRAIRSDGTPGGYQGGPAMKRALLEMEGIVFDRRGRAATGEFFY